MSFKNLLTLNIQSDEIKSLGAEYLARALRVNRVREILYPSSSLFK